MQGEKRRSFNPSWYNTFSWLEYSLMKDCAYCYACRHFSLPSTSESVFTSESGFSQWKKAMYKDAGFKVHEKSDSHITAMLAWSEHKKAALTDASVLNMLNNEYKKKVEENRSYIKTVADVLLLTATQNMAQRGHRESEQSDNKGNFLEILEMIAKPNPMVAKKMKATGNAKYTSNTIQNEILQCLTSMVQDSIVKEVKESEVFSIIADETKDLQKKEQLSLVLRYYYNGAVHESFLEMQHAQHLDAKGLSDMIIKCLESYELQYKSNLVGQGYDGASVMSGKHSGVAARIKTEAKTAFYVHCNAHCLNLVLVDTVKSVPEADCFFSLLEKIYVYMSGSYLHQKWLTVQKEMYGGTPRELQKLSDTRWACRAVACRNLMDRLPAVLCVLQNISAENLRDGSIDARGLLAQIDLTFIGLLATFRKVFGDTKLLSELLQSPSVDLAMAADMVESLLDTFQEYRTETFTDKLWHDIVETAKQCNIAVENVEKKRAHKVSTKLGGSYVTCTIGLRKGNADKDSFRQGLLYPILDTLVSEMERRFSKMNCSVMRGIQALNPKSSTFLQDDQVFDFGTIYGCDKEDLTHELHQARRILSRKAESGAAQLGNILDLTVFLEPYQEVFVELFRLCKIALALPVSSAACERSFSALKLIKTHLRTTMLDNRLSHLSLLSIESRRARALNMDDFIKVFASKHKNRRIALF
ncbi:zinc finger MYM-type protein 1-like isoform X2 [Gadus chalcogrammus]|nr:zinc finger MYM-type protein 1-like isoform X2 [Gadus chalcogrammus]